MVPHGSYKHRLRKQCLRKGPHVTQAALAAVIGEPVRVQIRAGNKVSRDDCAKAINRTPKTLAEWSRLGIGPRPHNIGGRIFYDWDDVQTFMRGKDQ